MTSEQLRQFLGEMGLTQAEFSRLLGVTPRAVTQWLGEGRTIPGPAEAYARAFTAMPASVRSLELRRTQESKPSMRDGMYAVQYQSQTAEVIAYGYATMLLDAGRIFGADPLGGKYDGTYTYDETVGIARVQLKVTFPPNVQAVFGPVHPFEWSIDISGNVDPRVEKGYTEFTTPFGPKIQAQYQFLRPLPEA